MNWLENNPLGVALAAVCGLMLLVSVGLAYIWSKPASSGVPVAGASSQAGGEIQRVMAELGPIAEYREVTARPVFNESRRPVVSIEGEGLDLEGSLETTVAGAPDVVLRGVIITPEVRIATLKPNSSGDTVIAHEGEPLEGEYAGWMVSDIKPRKVVLASLEGDTLELELQVYTRRIKEPPAPKPSPSAAAALAGAQAGNEGQPLSRAEEIRQRIAERREELRRQAEMEDQEAANKPAPISRYQSAIQNMINKKRDDKEQDKKSDDGSNG